MNKIPAVGVLQFPGSNCERETIMAVERSGMRAMPVLWHSNIDWDALDGLVIVGGFSYEDRCRSGLIASKDPVMTQVARQALKGN